MPCHGRATAVAAYVQLLRLTLTFALFGAHCCRQQNLVLGREERGRENCAYEGQCSKIEGREHSPFSQAWAGIFL